LAPTACHKIRSATEFDPSGTISQLGELVLELLERRAIERGVPAEVLDVRW
jgi:hypothetical protein